MWLLQVSDPDTLYIFRILSCFHSNAVVLLSLYFATKCKKFDVLCTICHSAKRTSYADDIYKTNVNFTNFCGVMVIMNYGIVQ